MDAPLVRKNNEQEGWRKTGASGQVLFTKGYQELKAKIHDRLLETIDLSLMDTVNETVLRQEIRKLVERILVEDNHTIPLNLSERERLLREVLDEVLGLGPLEPLMRDPS